MASGTFLLHASDSEFILMELLISNVYNWPERVQYAPND